MTRKPEKRTLRVAIERFRNSIGLELEASRLASLEASLLEPVEPDAGRPGSKPIIALRCGEELYVLKMGEPALIAAEEACHELRALAGRPTVPARRMEVEIESLGRLSGLMKPFLEFDAERELGADTQTWSELQRGVILLEHAWEWFLDNLDTNTSQYALLGPEGYPLNIDWDRAFSSEGRSPFTRFAKYKRTLPNARTFLYVDYVEGRVDLDFDLLAHESRVISRLPARKIRHIVSRYAALAFPDEPARARALVDRVLWRQRHVPGEVARFVKGLRAERAALTGAAPQDTEKRIKRVRTLIWNRTQPLLNAMLRGPVGTFARRALAFTRARQLGAPT